MSVAVVIGSFSVNSLDRKPFFMDGSLEGNKRSQTSQWKPNMMDNLSRKE